LETIKNKKMSDMWNKRYAQDEYVYGIQANEFFKEELAKLDAGKILFPGEGEGRNAVFAALKDWEVVAFDASSEAKKKAEKLATENNVKIDYSISTIEDFDDEENSFDAIVLIFVHPVNRELCHKKLVRYLKPGGKIIIEGFTKEQLANSSGGPKNQAMLFSKEELIADFKELKDLNITESETVLNEGTFHQGKASVIRLFGTK
jgi:2-polyprenyl-3-methyl-5-hydroxy-6-metoxy-1,4-benzoquinol methylase